MTTRIMNHANENEKVLPVHACLQDYASFELTPVFFFAVHLNPVKGNGLVASSTASHIEMSQYNEIGLTVFSDFINSLLCCKV